MSRGGSRSRYTAMQQHRQRGEMLTGAQFHATESAVKSVAEVEELVQQIEILAGGFKLGKGRKRNGGLEVEEETLIDAVAISHEFTDHWYEHHTLRTLYPSSHTDSIYEQP
jgi:hypothetical protein